MSNERLYRLPDPQTESAGDLVAPANFLHSWLSIENNVSVEQAVRDIIEAWLSNFDSVTPDVEAKRETEWPTEVSDELIAFARAAADVARKFGPVFAKEERMTMSNSAYKSQFCPKPNHIKPCWCGGEALCIYPVKRRRCARTAYGVDEYCWQHKPKEREER